MGKILENGNAKALVGILAAALVSSLTYGAMSYVAFFRDTVPRRDISTMIQIESPYSRDQTMILKTLQRIEAGQERLEMAVSDLQRKP